MVRSFLLASAAVLLAVPSAGAACRVDRGADLLARSASLVVTARNPGTDELRVVACHRRTGRRRTVTVLPQTAYGFAAPGEVRIAGRWVAVLSTYTDNDATQTFSVDVADAIGGRRRSTAHAGSNAATGQRLLLDRFVLDATGHAAWQVTLANHPDAAAVRALSALGAVGPRGETPLDLADRGRLALTGVRDGVVRWTRDGARRARRLG